ncbi:hypothetical protein NCCP1664_11170 [Zafaria cholistanensis]|uniref:Uncharacterized protein n=1 Tax=Zafaria cholistanensis TaxID=1682741 RepID=A0A5A7NPA4_9MICC|nr:hypothetical protein NCCP1664_11170 [Zafaria cholistanensis]
MRLLFRVVVCPASGARVALSSRLTTEYAADWPRDSPSTNPTSAHRNLRDGGTDGTVRAGEPGPGARASGKFAPGSAPGSAPGPALGCAPGSALLMRPILAKRSG